MMTYKTADKAYGEEEVKVWADNFAFPPMSVSGTPYANAQVLEVADNSIPTLSELWRRSKVCPSSPPGSFVPNDTATPLRMHCLRTHTVMIRLDSSVGLWPIYPWPGYHFADRDDAEDPRRSLVDGALGN